MPKYIVEVRQVADESLNAVVLALHEKYPNIKEIVDEYIVERARIGLAASGFPDTIKILLGQSLDSEEKIRTIHEITEFINELGMAEIFHGSEEQALKPYGKTKTKHDG